MKITRTTDYDDMASGIKKGLVSLEDILYYGAMYSGRFDIIPKPMLMTMLTLAQMLGEQD